VYPDRPISCESRIDLYKSTGTIGLCRWKVLTLIRKKKIKNLAIQTYTNRYIIESDVGAIIIKNNQNEK
jgi:hypothetical protein